MSELLDLANAYYTVAQDLERRGNELLAQAEYLSTCAGRICEENMRLTPQQKTGKELSP